MFSWGIGFILIGVLSFVIPMLGRQFILVTLFGLTGVGSTIAGLAFIGLGIALISIASKRPNHESPNMENPSTKAVQQPLINAASRDIWFINQTEILLSSLAPAIDVKSTAIGMFKATKEELEALKNVDIYSESTGDRIISKSSTMLSERLAAGLTREDIRLYWNQPPLMQRLQARAQDFVTFLIIKNAEDSGEDPIETLRNRRKINIHFGDPKTWDLTKPINRGFSSEDADIYPEFTMRVGIWSNSKTPEEKAALLSKHTSYNAMIRNLVRQGLV